MRRHAEITQKGEGLENEDINNYLQCPSIIKWVYLESLMMSLTSFLKPHFYCYMQSECLSIS
jgi:hypothetical protein